MKNFKHFAQRYVDWVIKLGRVRFSLLGLFLLAVLALGAQTLLSLFITNQIDWMVLVRSIIFGLFTAPFVIYFFTLLVEQLERSRLALSKTVLRLRNEVSERIVAEKKLSIALEKLEKNNREKSSLLATISHELRTPLNGIIGLSHILLDEQLSEKQRNYLKTINLSAVNLGHIFSDIIDLDKFDTNRLKLNFEPINLNELLNDIQNFAILMAEPKNLKFVLEIESNLPDLLYLDRARLSQILLNLIGNAVKFTEKGTIKLSIHALEKDIYRFSVSDTGRGIAQCELNNIFKMYYRVKEDTNRSSGSGIGLAISKNLALLMKGDIQVESQLGVGSTFDLTIYAKEAHPINNYEPIQPLNLSVLLVEDIELNVLVAKSVLEKLGHHVDVALNGKDAIKLFERNSYDIILLDINLPDMSGFDIASHLRQKYEDGIYDFLPPLVAFTANVMQSEEEYQSKGMDTVLRKPLVLEDLKRCFYHFFGEENIEFKVVEKQLAHQSLDLEQIELVVKTQTEQNLILFKHMMPAYLEELNDAFEVYSVDNSATQNVANIAHKIKGAAGSIGLITVQQLAEKIQCYQEDSWKDNIENWLDKLNTHWQTNVKELEDYLKL
ncbi:ATP-binding protein [Rodentibacter pneumotropicus]|uniref:ATP-binding protein n=1 Tax=Rodentibacter pneumotropicus TaxID=758 RepID=UPI0003821603|nr:ATP-binding protein [Rodentibacter pneumotropicus]NBH74914.1 hybrid sensor histidine kinase/response regulator [Rodentibacter pneumotropicus]OOF63895.1 hybrid sensor histidine kinase/response regulator [Rodentibacter pneumotropicus]THA08237.1 hybrid sensor histidine kinase/response regulator [Rodentibacter pneumotropicus]THA13643.1 hybrid sensor histidine kinase/response regulator [Rodentibacter pneumotropicus]THA14198.1 hybrid sensor histidine kinase/response regulator [Rodentibacter pneum